MNTITQTKQKAALLVVGIAIFLDMLIYGLVVPILPKYASALGASQTEIGLLFGSYAIALFIATPIFGALSDRIGRRGPMLWGLLGLAAATLLFAFAEEYWMLIAARALQGLAAAITWTSGLAILADLYPSEERGKAMGLALSGQAAGILLGPSLGGWMYQLGGYKLPFLFAAVLAIADGVLRVFLLRDLPERTSGTFLSSFGLLRNRSLLLICGVVVIGSAIPSVLEPTLPLHLQEKFNAEPGFIGMLFAIPTLSYALATPWIGKLASKIGYKKAVLIGLAVVAISLPLSALPGSMWMQGASLVLLGISMGMVLAPCLPALADISEQSGLPSYGITFALYNTAYSFGMIVGPVTSSALTDAIGLKLSYLSVGCVALLYMLILLPSLRKREVTRLNSNAQDR
ncbi:MFS transporter [Paenibacillus jilunlii]|uniref:Multidrug resistance protein n=1 Tax=Paenibacillus jilunlii TaxID=682956 RepID=A0A1G9J561_9BACL|nr:MFS transporter [Paenibacillus jilunlii]KWX74763.1 permease [Paenibacillus jilunlii]SDL32481.1 Multidrug resistance protein [Paenibacillus jilunlii]